MDLLATTLVKLPPTEEKTNNNMNWPNFVTFTRIALIPAVILVYYSSIQGNMIWAAAVFAVASLTDWLDGYLARELNLTSDFGAFIDPVADKVLVVVVLVFLVSIYPSIWFVIPTCIIIAREVMVSALREWMASSNRRNIVAVVFMGKLKTTVQMIAIIVLIASDPAGEPLFWQFGYVLLYTSAILSLWSMLYYFKSAWTSLSINDKD